MKTEITIHADGYEVFNTVKRFDKKQRKNIDVEVKKIKYNYYFILTIDGTPTKSKPAKTIGGIATEVLKLLADNPTINAALHTKDIFGYVNQACELCTYKTPQS